MSIHTTAMDRFMREGFVLEDALTIVAVPAGFLMSGRIRCEGGILIDVDKLLAVLSGAGSTAVVQTVAYGYHVAIDGVGNLVRYCSPHDDDVHPDHKPFHHKHSFDVFAGDVEGRLEAIDEATWPTLGEVIEEARTFYYENLDKF